MTSADGPAAPGEQDDTSGPAVGQRTSGRRLFRNTAAGAGASFISMIVALALIPFLINRLGEEAYGVWVLALSFSLAGGYLSLADLGLQASLVKFVAEVSVATDGRKRVESFVGSATLLFGVMGLVAAAVLIVLALTSSTLFNVAADLQVALRTLLLMLAAEALIGMPALSALGLLEGLQRYGLIRAVEVGRHLMFAGAAIVVVGGGGGVVALGVVSVVAAVMGHLTLLIAARITWGKFIHPRFHRTSLLQLSRFGGWLSVTKVVGTIWRQMDKTILSVMVSVSVLAPYDVASRLQGAAASVLSFTSSAVLPVASALTADSDVGRLHALLLRGTRYTLALSIPTALAGIVLAPDLLEHWIGHELPDAAIAVRLFLSYQLFLGAATIALSLLYGLGEVRAAARIALLALGLNLGASLLLAPTYGVRGVVLATVLAYASSTVLYVRLTLRVTGLTWRTYLAGCIAPLMPWAAVFIALLVGMRMAWRPGSLLEVFLLPLVPGVAYAAGVGFVAFSGEERALVRGYLRKDNRR